MNCFCFSRFSVAVEVNRCRLACRRRQRYSTDKEEDHEMIKIRRTCFECNGVGYRREQGKVNNISERETQDPWVLCPQESSHTYHRGQERRWISRDETWET